MTITHRCEQTATLFSHETLRGKSRAISQWLPLEKSATIFTSEMIIHASIEAAFADVPYPNDDNITRCTHEDCLECAEIAEHFRGTNWRDHSLEQLLKYRSAISMFTPEALHYFLPAFMLQSLEHWNEADEIASSIAGLFLPAKPDANVSMQQYHAARWTKFNQQQRIAIAGYLREFSFSDSPLTGVDIEQAISRLSHAPTDE